MQKQRVYMDLAMGKAKITLTFTHSVFLPFPPMCITHVHHPPKSCTSLHPTFPSAKENGSGAEVVPHRTAVRPLLAGPSG